jgi:hypothetical protein
MKITILKTHQSNCIWFHAGMTVEVNDLRAQELIHAGLAVAIVENNNEAEVKVARHANNKAVPVAKNK